MQKRRHYEDHKYKIHQVTTTMPRMVSSRVLILIIGILQETTYIVERAIHVYRPQNEILSEANQSRTLMTQRDWKTSIHVLMELTLLDYPEKILHNIQDVGPAKPVQHLKPGLRVRGFSPGVPMFANSSDVSKRWTCQRPTLI
jgi:hypothetical protein